MKKNTMSWEWLSRSVHYTGRGNEPRLRNIVTIEIPSAVPLQRKPSGMPGEVWPTTVLALSCRYRVLRGSAFEGVCKGSFVGFFQQSKTENINLYKEFLESVLPHFLF